jgi:hypothetical protein
VGDAHFNFVLDSVAASQLQNKFRRLTQGSPSLALGLALPPLRGLKTLLRSSFALASLEVLQTCD